MATPQRMLIPAVLAASALSPFAVLALTSTTLARSKSEVVPGFRPAASDRKVGATGERLSGADSSSSEEALVTRLTQLDSGHGVLVCEPAARGTDAATTSFGAGCARWLHLIVGGHGELGRTPLWSSVHPAQRELRKSHLRLTLAEAAQLPRSLGITHAALGEVQGNARSCTLRYRLWKLPGKKAVGQPVTVTGTRDQVIAALPGMAKQLCRALGVPSPRVPASPGETAEEFQRLGRLPWYPTNLYLSDAQLDELLKLTRQGSSSTAGEPRSPRVLAALHATLFYGSARDAGGVERMARRLIRALPDNALVWAEVGRQADTTEKADARVLPPGGLASNLERFPNSYLFRTAESYFYRLSGQVEEGRRAAEHAVRCAARNPDAWLCLNAGIYVQANAIRQGRTLNRMTRQEREYCSTLYEEQLPVALQSVRLNPQYARAWYKISTTAAFQGGGELADVAFWKAVDLDPGFQPTYRWGLELYQPKWLDDPEKLEWVVRKAAEASKSWNAAARLEIAFHSHVIGEHINHARLASLAKPLLRTGTDRAELKAALDRHHRECPKG